MPHTWIPGYSLSSATQLHPLEQAPCCGTDTSTVAPVSQPGCQPMRLIAFHPRAAVCAPTAAQRCARQRGVETGAISAATADGVRMQADTAASRAAATTPPRRHHTTARTAHTRRRTAHGSSSSCTPARPRPRLPGLGPSHCPPDTSSCHCTAICTSRRLSPPSLLALLSLALPLSPSPCHLLLPLSPHSPSSLFSPSVSRSLRHGPLCPLRVGVRGAAGAGGGPCCRASRCWAQ